MVCRKYLGTILVLSLLLSLSAGFAFAASTPEGPTTLDIESTSRRTAVASPTLDALAGNVTQLTIEGLTVTQSWQGYYGNVTGTITLDDASNNTMYDWTLASPEGEVYAATSTIDWSSENVKCYDYNYSQVGDSSYVTLTELESSLNLNTDDIDGIDETFLEAQTYESFYVGEYQINNASMACPTTQTYNGSETKDGSDFQEVILYDNSTDVQVYTAILEETEPTGFNDLPWDFQMLVAEDGHNGDTGTTTYYFYVELE